jgi:hypothetical protein
MRPDSPLSASVGAATANTIEVVWGTAGLRRRRQRMSKRQDMGMRVYTVVLPSSLDGVRVTYRNHAMHELSLL